MKSLISHLAKETKFEVNTTEKVRNAHPHRIKFRGEFIRTASNKTVWPNLGGAKNAFNRDIDAEYKRLIFEDFNYNRPIDDDKGYLLTVRATGDKLDPMTILERRKFYEAYKAAILAETEFVPVTTDEFYNKKK